MFEDLSKDVRHAVRGLVNNPLFAGVAIVMLALGIGANAAIFSVVNSVILRTLPVRNPQQVFFLQSDGQPDRASDTGNPKTSFSEYVFEQLRNDHQAFADVIAYVPLGFNKIAVSSGNLPQEAAGEMVSGKLLHRLRRERAMRPPAHDPR